MKLYGLLLCAVSCVAGSLAAQGPQVKLDSGTIQGSTAAGVIAYKGVPFAAPPVGALRWRAPQPVKPWTGVKQTTAYSADCMQVPFPSDAAPLGTKPAEDCLYANVWLPAEKPAGKLPVMVWIYGGGWVNGGSSPDVYSGEHFAKQGVLFVSFNYRLGRFGFFAHPALTAENADGMLGNYGYMDQIAALKWVQRNAAAFGGDPGNVTVFGESAGGYSVHMLLGTSLADGLFQHAIVESGGGRGLGRPALSGSRPGLPSAESTGLAFAKAAGIEGTGKEALAKLRALPAETVRGDLNMATGRTNASTYSGVITDGKIVTTSGTEAYLTGTTQKVSLMVGANSADAGGATGDNADALFATFGPHAAEAKAAYMTDGSQDFAVIKGEVGRDRGMLEPARFVAATYAARGIDVYEYRYSYVATSMREKWKNGVPHATEIPFVFDTVGAKYGAAVTPSDEKISQQTLQYWANFAKTGNPNGAGLPEWPKYDATKDMLMDFTMDGPVAKADPWKKRMDAAEEYNSSMPTVR